MLTTQILQNSKETLDLLSHALTDGSSVALPTETVYGLAANAFDPTAVLGIFQTKDRPKFDPLIVHFSKELLAEADPLQALERAGIISGRDLSPLLKPYYRKIVSLWPGPLSILFPKGPKIPSLVTSGLDTVALRCPDHALFQSVLSRVPFPLAAPSANRFGQISPTSSQEVLSELEGRIEWILDGGKCSVGVESTIIQFIENPLELQILRPGKISALELETLLKIPVRHMNTTQHFGPHSPGLLAPGLLAPGLLAPGLLESHYAPRKPFYRIPCPFSDPQSKMEIEAILKHNPGKVRLFKILGDGSLDPAQAAKNLFSELRAFDQSKDDLLITETLGSEDGLLFAIENRIKRASKLLHSSF